MQGQTTIITDPERKDQKTFAFDHSYWSHSGYKENVEGVFLPENKESNYADQVCICHYISLPNLGCSKF